MLRLQFGFARQITVGLAGKRPARGADASEALAPEPSSSIADDTPLALGQVRWCGDWLMAGRWTLGVVVLPLSRNCFFLRAGSPLLNHAAAATANASRTAAAERGFAGASSGAAGMHLVSPGTQWALAAHKRRVDPGAARLAAPPLLGAAATCSLLPAAPLPWSERPSEASPAISPSSCRGC